MMGCLLSLLLFSTLAGVYSYNYLAISPFFGHSHMKFIGKVADTLTDAGHRVTMLMPVMDTSLIKKPGVNSTKQLIIHPVDSRVDQLVAAKRNGMMKDVWTVDAGPLTLLDFAYNMSTMFAYACENMVNDDVLMDSLRASNFDCGIAEPFNICGLAMIEALNIKCSLGASSVTQMAIVSSAIGEPLASSYVPAMKSSTGPKMNMLQRLVNTAGNWLAYLYFKQTFDAEMAVFKNKYGDSFKSYEVILAEMSFFFTNSNPYLNYPRPLIHKTVEIGGLTVDTGKKAALELEKKWDAVLNERNYTVFVSFGSVAKSADMPQEYKDTLLSVCFAMPDVTFIWKYEEPSDMADHIPNLHLSPWLPQNALLADPRLSLFFTHGGLGSANELAHLGKPAIVIPLFAEQPRNAAMLASQGVALVLEKWDLGNKQKIINTIRKILDDESFAQKAKRLAEMLTSTPISPKELLVKHAEFAARFGRLPHLDPLGRHLSFIQYYQLDAVACLSIIFLVTLKIVQILYRIIKYKYVN